MLLTVKREVIRTGGKRKDGTWRMEGKWEDAIKMVCMYMMVLKVL